MEQTTQQSKNKEYIVDSENIDFLKDIIFIGFERIKKSMFYFLILFLYYSKCTQVATVQGLSGTGSLRLGAALIERYFPGAKVLISAPTWGVQFILSSVNFVIKFVFREFMHLG